MRKTIFILILIFFGISLYSQNKIKIEKADDLPKHYYNLEGHKAMDYINNRDLCIELADKLEMNLKSDLVKYDIQDKATMRGYYADFSTISVLKNDLKTALLNITEGRKLTEKESDKYMWNLLEETYIFCKMTLILNVFFGLIGVIILVIFGFWIYFQVWKNNAEKNLPKNSIIFESSQGAIEYYSGGEITNPVLVLHGTPGSVFVNMLFEDIFSHAGLSMVSVSRPGYYQTPLSSGKTLEEQSKLYKLLLDELGIESLFVFGISGGGPAAIQFALDYPERCKGVILAAAVTQKMAPSGLENMLYSNEFLLWLAMQGMAMSVRDKEFLKKMRPYFKLGIFPFKFASQGYYNDNSTFNDLELDLTALEVPVLLIHGTMDKDVPFSFSEDAHQKIPNSTLIRMDGIGHPDVLNNEMAQKALNEFVRKY